MPEVAPSVLLPTEMVTTRSSGSVYGSSGSSALTVMLVAASHSLTRVGLTLSSTVAFSFSSLSVIFTEVLPTR